MKKKVFGAVALIAIAVAAGWNYQQSQQESELSDLTLANVEALASGESSDCPNGCYDNGSGCFCHYWFPSYREAN